MQALNKWIVLTILTGLILTACAPNHPNLVPPTERTGHTPTSAPVRTAGAAPTPTDISAFLQTLPNADYSIELTSSGKAQLKDGVYTEPAAPGSAAKITVQLGDERAVGDLNGDGAQDAAVTLVADSGGSGTFTYLAAVIDDQGTAKPSDSVLLGDRIIVTSLAVRSGSVVVNLLTRQPDEPMSAEPTLEETLTFALQGEKLVEVK